MSLLPTFAALAVTARASFWRECTILSTNGFSPPEHSGASQHRTGGEDQERRDERAEMVVIAISLVLLISALLAILGTVLLSRPALTRHVSAQWIPRLTTRIMPLFDLKLLTELAAGGVGASNRRH